MTEVAGALLDSYQKIVNNQRVDRVLTSFAGDALEVSRDGAEPRVVDTGKKWHAILVVGLLGADLSDADSLHLVWTEHPKLQCLHV